MLAGQPALLGESAEACVGQRSFPGKAQEGEHGCNKLEGTEAPGVLLIELLQVRSSCLDLCLYSGNGLGSSW